jgi:predicted metal-dependent phosphoesterase TrpH
MPADLHLHTVFSDGTFTPEEVVERATRCGLGAIAVTDHDTVEGCARMAAACAGAGVEFVPGTELTSEFDGHELHLLGYFIDPGHPRLLREMETFQQVRRQRILDMTARLNALGVPLAAEEVFALANCRSPGRPHVARALVRAKVCADLDEAFERFLKRGKSAWAPKFRMAAPDAIALIHEAGGLAVMAHPGLNRCDEVIPALVEAGLDGLECFHTRHHPGLSAHYLSLAAKFRLLVTGGSDCHGMNKGRPLIGSVRLADEYFERLKARHALPAAAAPGP